MMKCIEAGGMRVAYSERRDAEMNTRWGEADYVPNKAYYELEQSDYLEGNLAERFEGMVIKCLWGGALRLPPPGPYHFIVMRRPSKEIRTSLISAFGADTPASIFPDLDKTLDDFERCLIDRRSTLSLNRIEYHDIIERPLETLQKLDWPIDATAASKVPIKTKARYLWPVKS